VADKLDVVRGAGADRTIDFRSGDYTRTGPYERIVDKSAKRSMLEVRRALAPAGVYVAIGGRTSRILQLGLVGAWTALTGRRRMGLLIYMKPRHPDLVDLAGLLASGDIAPVIDRTVALADTADAFRRSPPTRCAARS
jgi:NADPH:quinone reductase-like Zn-dependent oxidoreductase